MFLNILVAVIKVAVGLVTGTLAMVADGFHSTMDASSNLIGVAGTTIAARPADDNHPYGHRRFETMARQHRHVSERPQSGTERPRAPDFAAVRNVAWS